MATYLVLSKIVIGLLYGMIALMFYFIPNAFAPMDDKVEYSHRELLFSAKCWGYRALIVGVMLALAGILALYFYVWVDIVCFHGSAWLNDYLIAHYHYTKERAFADSMGAFTVLYLLPIMVMVYWRMMSKENRHA